MLSMESTSNRMSRLGQVGHLRHRADDVRPDLRRDRRRRRRGSRGARERAAAAGAALRLGRRARTRIASAPPSSARTRRSSRAPRHEARVLRRGGQGRARARAGARARRATRCAASSSATSPTSRGLDAAVDFTTPDAAPANVRAALEQGVSCVVGTTGWDAQQLDALARERGLRLFVAPNFSLGAVLMMRFARAGGAVLPARGDHRAAQRGEEGRAVRHRSARRRSSSAATRSSTPCACPGLVAHQEVIFGGEGQLLTIRHDTTGARVVRRRRAARAREARLAAAGPDRRARRAPERRTGLPVGRLSRCPAEGRERRASSSSTRRRSATATASPRSTTCRSPCRPARSACSSARRAAARRRR